MAIGDRVCEHGVTVQSKTYSPLEPPRAVSDDLIPLEQLGTVIVRFEPCSIKLEQCPQKRLPLQIIRAVSAPKRTLIQSFRVVCVALMPLRSPEAVSLKFVGRSHPW